MSHHRQTPPRRLRTNYTEDDFQAFMADLEVVMAAYPESVRKADHKAVLIEHWKNTAILESFFLIPITIGLIIAAVKGILPWWNVPLVQSIAVAVLTLRFGSVSSRADTILIYREADRRGIRYDPQAATLAAIMNRINADYNRRGR